MKLENTLENKAKFFAQYWGQKVFKISIKQDIPHKNTFGKSIEFNDFLELRHISNISNEEAILMYRGLESNYENAKQFLEDYAAIGFLSQNEVDILRSKGFAVPWMDLEIEDLIEYGWIKIK